MGVGWEKTPGTQMTVYTYGSGCASTMYQTLFHDIPYMKPYAEFRTAIYRDSYHRHPEICGRLCDIYADVWMKFGYYPHGRQTCGEDICTLWEDTYYLMEIDSYGRRFYHRGGLITKPIDDKFILRVDSIEGRPCRADMGPLPPMKDKSEFLSGPLNERIEAHEREANQGKK